MPATDQGQNLQGKIHAGHRTTWLRSLHSVDGHVRLSSSVNVRRTKAKIISEPMVSVDDTSASIGDVPSFVRIECDAVRFAESEQLGLHIL